MSVFVGIHDGHNASVAVVRDGRIELALQEERLTRIKNQGDAPAGAAKLAFQMLNADGARVALNGGYMNYHQWQRETILGDYERSADLASRWKQLLKGTFVDREYQRRKAERRAEALSEICISRDRTETVEHHLAHASAAYHTAPWKDEKVLVLTCDGSGDRLSATVSVGERGTLSRIATVSEHDSIGRLYALVTRYLGMVPLEHEYKVMGLAPYVAPGSRTESAARGSRACSSSPRVACHGSAAQACRPCTRPPISSRDCSPENASTRSQPARKNSSKTCSSDGSRTRCVKLASTKSPARVACS